MFAAAMLLVSSAVVQGDGLRLEFDDKMASRVVATLAGEQPLGPFMQAETLRTAKGELSPFTFVDRAEKETADDLGSGRQVTLRGRSGTLLKQLEVTAYRDKPGWLFMRVRYTNEGREPVQLLGYISNRYVITPQSKSSEPAFWSYQSSSHESRPDWIAPVALDSKSTNFLGMNDSDYGGGTPLVDLWRADLGIAVGHVELVPKQVSLPVHRTKDGNATVALVANRRMSLAPGESTTTVRTFLTVHRGDFFTPLRAYSGIMQAQGLKLPSSPKDAFDPIWCAWGYGRTFTPQQVFETLPVVRQLGFGWAVLDDGWQIALGDWRPRADKFPAGDADMKALVDRIHAAGLKAQLWWAPLGADSKSRTAREHPQWLLKNADGSTRKITWWNSQYLCPAFEPVREDAAQFARKALSEWGFDGLKIDGQHLNAAPACFNSQHAHASPDDGPEGMPGFFKAIWDAAQAAKPGALIEICPCGTGYSFFTLPYLNMTVASDPESSWQVRLKGKALKALTGDRLAYFGDHVEMSEGGEDYASTFALGGVIGTNFAWPGAPGKKDKTLLLTPRREKSWGQWTQLYADKRLSEGEYLGGLYDMGFDRPEAHVIRKDGVLYYGFFAKSFRGAVNLRGLAPGQYWVTDYVRGRDLGEVSGPTGTLNAEFERSLLIEVRPK